MQNDRGQQDKDHFWKYINIVLISMVIIMGMNRFGFNRRAEVVSSSGNSLGDIALEYYFEKYPDEIKNNNTEATVKNFGCHKEIYIYRDGDRVMRLSYSNGRIYELD